MITLFRHLRRLVFSASTMINLHQYNTAIIYKKLTLGGYLRFKKIMVRGIPHAQYKISMVSWRLAASEISVSQALNYKAPVPLQVSPLH